MRPERAGPIAGVILAAGVSSRMGRNKLFLAISGETLLRRCVKLAGAARLDPVLVVLGHEAERAAAEVGDLPCLTVLNAAYENGQGSSLRAGIGAVPRDRDAAVVLLADMPLVTRTMIEALVERYRATDVPLVISEYGGVHAPPTLYTRALFGEIASLPGAACGKQVVRRHRPEASAVGWPAETLVDLDVPEDLERVQAALAAGERPCAATS